MIDVKTLEEEYEAVCQATRDAWAAFTWHRACLWSFAAFHTISLVMRRIVQSGKLPTDAFLERFRLIRGKMIDEAYRLPEFEKYQDCLREQKEMRMIVLDVKRRQEGLVVE